jgi:hypothetical protein
VGLPRSRCRRDHRIGSLGVRRLDETKSREAIRVAAPITTAGNTPRWDHFRKPVVCNPQLPPPTEEQAGADVRLPRHIGHHRSRGNCRRNHRPLPLKAETPPPFRAAEKNTNLRLKHRLVHRNKHQRLNRRQDKPHPSIARKTASPG